MSKELIFLRNGFRIFEQPTQPEFLVIPRRWKERLFSKPWKPMQKTKQIPNPRFADNGKIIQMENNLYMTKEMRIKLLEAMKEEIIL